MRIAVIGVGGTGAYFGGLLARAGHDVAFLARGATLAALRERGLTVKSATVGDFALPVVATDDPAAVGPVDLVLFCVKSYDTDAAARLLPPLVGPETAVLSVQNGVDNEERLAAVVGPATVLGAIAGVSAYIEAPAVIAERGGATIIRFGELAGGVSPRAERLAGELAGAGFAIEALPDMRVQLWEKFVFICAFSGVTSLARLPIGAIRAEPAADRLYRGVMDEVATVGRAAGVALPDDSAERWYRQSASLPPGIYGSMYHDLAAGRRMELEGLNGTVVRLGEARGIPTPLNFAVYAALRPHAGGRAEVPR
jgi:2-dehydropantoate 2-reductase